MKYFCTHSDRKYLVKGINLFRSIKEHMREDFRLYYLCVDDETFDILKKLAATSEFEWLKPIQLPAIITPQALHDLRSMPASAYGDQYSQFCWALTPYFTNWLLQNEIPPNGELLYCDADIYFYHTPAHIFHKCWNSSVGIHRHRFRTYDVETNNVGEFNVGCVYFMNNDAGKKISDLWKYLLVTPNNQYYKKYGTCGDQKYWDVIYPTYVDDICIFDPKDGDLGHGAPWNFNYYKFPSFGSIEYDGKVQRLIFNHFSHFVTTDTMWKSSDHGEWKPEDVDEAVMKYYQHYYEQCKISQTLISK